MLNLFSAQLAEAPQAVAVVDDESTVTYAQLDRESRAYRRLLSRHGVGPEHAVAVVAERGPRYVAMVLGVLRSGAAFLPVEPTTPLPRARLMCRTAQVRAILVEPGHESYASALTGPTESAPVLVATGTATEPGPDPNRPDQGLAYVIFTSGSTGEPKGAMVTDGGMNNHLAAKVEFLCLGRNDVVGFTAPLSFDISVWQVLAALCAGGRVAAAPAVLPDPVELAGWVERHSVTVLEIVPSLLTVLLDLVTAEELRSRLRSLRFLIATGEALPVELARRWYECCPTIPLVNAYGPTECADDVTHHLVTPEDWTARARPPIGREIINTSIYIVDGDGAEVPAGAPGDLLVGGRGVGRGYVADPARTALVFVPDHLSGTPGARLYRTGDRAARDKDGAIDFLGRRDRQVKIRGHRVELGDVEAQLLQVEGVTGAACVLAGDRLYGYVTRRGAAPGSAPAVLDLLRAQAPSYLVPHEVIVLDRFPTGSSGKVDYQALARRGGDPGHGSGHATGDRLAAARALFAEVIGIPAVAAEDDFFGSGGDSLQAMKLMALARSRFNRPGASLRGFLAEPTPRGLVAVLDRTTPPEPAGPAVEVEPGALSTGQERLWFLEQLHPRRGAQLLRLVLTLHGPLERPALQHALDAVVRRHEPMRTVFSQRVGVPVQSVWPSARLVPELVAVGADGTVPDLLHESGLSASRTQPPLAAAQLARIGPDHHVLTMVLHHLVADGWSLGILGEEIGAYYERWLRGDAEIAVPALSYRDYVAEERRWLAGEEAAECERYWRAQLDEAPPALALPWDRPRPARPGFAAGSVVCQLSSDQTAALVGLSRSLGATPFMTVVAATYAALRGLTGARDMVLGIDSANRSWTGADQMIGTFVNQLPVRLSAAEPAGSFADLVRLAREQCLGAYDHERLPFHRIVAAVNPPRRAGSSPLFQVKITQQGSWRTSLDLPSIQVTPTVVAEPVTHLDLILDVSGEFDRLRLELLYPTEALEEASATGWLNTVASVLREAAVPVAGLPAVRTTRHGGTSAGPAPRTPTEAVVAEVWCDVLELSEVSVTDNFFEVGGYSLAAVRVLHELTARTGVELDLETYFESETLAEVAAALDRLSSAGPPGTGAATFEGEL